MQPVILKYFCDAINFETHFVMPPWEFYIRFYCQVGDEGAHLMPIIGLITLMSTLKRHLQLYFQTGKCRVELTKIVIEIAHILGTTDLRDNKQLNIMFFAMLMFGGLYCDTVLVASEYFKHAPKFDAKDVVSMFHPELLLRDDEFCEEEVCSFEIGCMVLMCELHLDTFHVLLDNVDGDKYHVFKELMRGYVDAAQKWDNQYEIPEYVNNLTPFLRLFNDDWEVHSWQELLGNRARVEFIFPTTIATDDRGRDAEIHTIHCGWDCEDETHAMDGCDGHWLVSKYILDCNSAKLAALPRWAGETHSAILHNFAPWAMAHPASGLMSVGNGDSLRACEYEKKHMQHWANDATYTWMRERGIQNYI